jgi:hypothetical protein
MNNSDKAYSNTIYAVCLLAVLVMTAYSLQYRSEHTKDVCNSVNWDKIGFWYKGAIDIGTDGSTAVITHIWQDNVEATNCLSDYAQSKKKIKVRGETFIPMTMDYAFLTEIPGVLENANGEKYNAFKFAEESIMSYGDSGAQYLLISAPLKGAENYARVFIVAEASKKN